MPADSVTREVFARIETVAAKVGLIEPPTKATWSPTEPAAAPAGERLSALRRALEGIIGVPATEENRVEVLRNGNEIFPAMLGSIAGARRTIDLLTFVYWRGEIGAKFADALSERALSGVRVRYMS